MPKIYSEEERRKIVRDLKKQVDILIREKGVKKTTVDELVQRTGIPKGTFYLFYPSKEMLIYECAQDLHKQVDEHINRGMREADKDSVEEVTDVLMGAIDITMNSCLKVLLEPESMNLVLRKIPEDVLREHGKNKDDNELQKLLDKKGINMKGAFTMILMGSMYKQVIGEDNIKESTRYLVRGLVEQILR